MRAIVSVVVTLFLVSAANAQSNVLLNEWGEYGGKPGQFKFPTMIAINSRSDIYVVDQHNHRVQKFDSSGNFITLMALRSTHAIIFMLLT